jgi:hypothetical protein
MATIRKEFDGYSIQYHSGTIIEATIFCYDGPRYVARIQFHKDDAAISNNADHATGPWIHYPISRFNDVITILREEKPLYLHLNLDKSAGRIATDSREPVGEEES